MTTRIRKYIEVKKNKCVKCGKKVTDHHILCNSCWGKTAKILHQQKMKKMFDKVRAPGKGMNKKSKAKRERRIKNNK